MTHIRPELSLGDAIRALSILRPTDEATTREILSMVRLVRPIDSAQPAPPDAEPAPPEQDVEPPAPHRGREADRAVPEEGAEESPLGDEVPSALEMRPASPAKGVEDVPALPKEEVEPTLPAIEPLLLPRWVRGIVSAALSVPFPDGPPHVERIVDAVARGVAIEEVPRRSVPTLRLGVELLVDRGARMVPFWQDQTWLERALRRVVGEGGVRTRAFTGSPLSALPPDGAGDQARPPSPGTPVLALTDVGIARPMFDPDESDHDDWLVLAQQLRRASCPLILFVPYPPSRWPRSLARELTIIQWDRVTTAATVRGSLGPAGVS
jgi:hypothetical protein